MLNFPLDQAQAVNRALVEMAMPLEPYVGGADVKNLSNTVKVLLVWDGRRKTGTFAPSINQPEADWPGEGCLQGSAREVLNFLPPF